MFLAKIVVAACFVTKAFAHSRLGMPKPDDYVTSGASNGAQGTANCGHNPKVAWGTGAGGVTDFAPGYATIQINEIAMHNGPYRLCLTDANEVCRYVLADHIPQNTNGVINYYITVWLPNVKCDATTQCKIQQIWLLTNGNECRYYDRNAAVQKTLPTGVTPPACNSGFYSCASITISGTQSLDTIAPLTLDTSVTTGTFYKPVDGQPSVANGGQAWPYSSANGFTPNLYSVTGKAKEAITYATGGIVPSLVGTKLGTNFGSPNSSPVSAPSRSPTVLTKAPSKSPNAAPTSTTAPTATLTPTVDTNELPTSEPIAQAAVGMGNAAEVSSAVGAVVGVFSLFAVLFVIFLFRAQIRDVLFGSPDMKTPLNSEWDRNYSSDKNGKNGGGNGKYEFGNLDKDNDPNSWVEMTTNEGRIYWYNVDTAQTLYNCPSCLENNNTANPNEDSSVWSTHYTDEGRPYYFNSANGMSTYDKPKCLV